MTSQLFHLIMLVCVGLLSWVSWHGYRDDQPFSERGIIKLNIAAAIWFFYLFIVAAPGLSDFVGGGFFVLAFLGIANIRHFIRGFDYLFIAHPAEPIVHSALDNGEPIDGRRLADALRSDGGESPKMRGPAFHYEHQTKKARAMRAKLDADAALAEAAINRERMRAAARDTPPTRKTDRSGLRLTKDDRI